MREDLRVPANLLAATATGGPARAAWLQALPSRIEELTERWGLRVGEPFEPGGVCSWTAPGIDGGGRAIVLKVAWRHTEALHEAEGLAALGGAAAVEVYAFEHLAPSRPEEGTGDTTALLLERCLPGGELRELPESDQHPIVTDLLRLVWAVPLSGDHPFRPLSEMAEEWVTEAESHRAADPGRLDPGLAREGLGLFRQLATPSPDDVLVFTDVHAENILSARRRPWLLIDPKPYVGDPHYDVLQHILNCGDSAQADAIGLVGRVADLAGLDRERLRLWLFARCVQELLNPQTPWPGLELVLRQVAV